ncbi:hypothetical protein ACIBG6_06930 [Streptomyces sp. NPDC050842]|uniref:hypothetical protein n=1 Tax=Streptomyces sp. NPDC050842 TaxID=3365636 RepID=UPI003799B4C2
MAEAQLLDDRYAEAAEPVGEDGPHLLVRNAVLPSGTGEVEEWLVAALKVGAPALGMDGDAGAW